MAAEANTSTGAPPSICFWRVPEASKLNVVVEPLAASKAAPISVKAALRLEAAETVRVLRRGCGGGVVGGGPLPSEVVTAACSDPQAASR